MLIEILSRIVMFIIGLIIVIFWARDREKLEREEHERYMNDDRT